MAFMGVGEGRKEGPNLPLPTQKIFVPIYVWDPDDTLDRGPFFAHRSVKFQRYLSAKREWQSHFGMV